MLLVLQGRDTCWVIGLSMKGRCIIWSLSKEHVLSIDIGSYQVSRGMHTVKCAQIFNV